MEKFLTYDLETTFLQKKQKRPATRILEIALSKADECYQNLVNPCEKYATGEEIINSLDEMKQHVSFSITPKFALFCKFWRARSRLYRTQIL